MYFFPLIRSKLNLEKFDLVKFEILDLLVGITNESDEYSILLFPPLNILIDQFNHDLKARNSKWNFHFCRIEFIW